VLDGVVYAPALLVVCEFDGTIAEYVADPSEARPLEGALDILTRLGSLPDTRAAVISGRSLQSLRAACGAESDDPAAWGVELIGSGGMEIESQMTLGLTADAKRMRGLLVQAAEVVAGAHPGITVDEKPFGVALHVRGADAVEARRAVEQMLMLASALPQRVYTQSRSYVLDLAVLPVGQDWAIDALREREHATVFYAGNDERAFAALSAHDVGCTVGSVCSGAVVHLDTPAQLIDLLGSLHDSRAARPVRL
jgi:trehalose 6-phosphate phosphatase